MIRFLKELRNQFLLIFQSPNDIHRVLAIGLISVFCSHVSYLSEIAKKTQATVGTEMHVLYILVGMMAVFVTCWAVFSSIFNPLLYLRQGIIAGWGILLHRLFYGTESLGSFFTNVMMFIGWTFLVPFIFSGTTPKRFVESLRRVRPIETGLTLRKKEDNTIHIKSEKEAC